MSWIYLALLTPLLFAIVVLIDDNLIHHTYRGASIGALISGIFGGLPLLSLFFVDYHFPGNSIALLAALAGFLTVVYYYFYFKALERESPSVVIALFSLTPVTIPLFAHYLLGEQLSTQQLIGFAIVLTASFLLAAVDIRKFKFSKALVPVIIAALIFDVISLVSKYVYEQSSFYSGYVFFCLGMLIGGLYFFYVLFFSGTHAEVKRLIKRNSMGILLVLALAEFINIMAEFVQNLALSRGPVSLVKVFGGIQPVYILLIALLFYPVYPKFFREAEHGRVRQKLILMAIIILGIVLAGSS